MKELIKPNSSEDAVYDNVESYCELDCNQDVSRICNKHCSGAGTTNGIVTDDDDILF